jgi:hypothetical protein
MIQVGVVGARGQLGKELSEFLEAREFHVYRVVRESPNLKEIGFCDFLDTHIMHCSTIFDFALLDFESMIRLRNSCEYRKIDLLYMSSVVVNQEARWKDKYCKYKISQYRIYRTYDRSIPIYGDLFVNEGGFLGYWNYLSTNALYVSNRSLYITLTKSLFDDNVSSILTGKLNKERVKTVIVSQSLLNLIFRLKINKVLAFLKINVVK